MDLRQAAQSIIEAAPPNLTYALALCGANSGLREEVEALWSASAPGPASHLPAITVSGRFRILQELGRGGLATVYLAHDASGLPVALKIACPKVAAAESSCTLRGEYLASSAVTHPNVRRVREFFTERQSGRSVQGLVMDYIVGEPLHTRLARGPLSPSELIPFAHGLAAGIDAIHAAGLVHGDLKPGNILLRANLSPVIIDLGSTSPGGCATASPDYMSPNQFRGLPATPADDLFALGAVLFEAATGHRPWPKEDILPAAIRRATEDAPVLTDVPPSFAAAVAALLSRHPSARPASATAALTLPGYPSPSARSCRHRRRP